MMTSSKHRKFTFNCLLKDIKEVSVAFLKFASIFGSCGYIVYSRIVSLYMYSFPPQYSKDLNAILRTFLFLTGHAWAGPEGGGGKGSPEKIGFLSGTNPDPLKNHKVTKPILNVGPSSARQRNAI